ncbi:MAG: anaerobic ribonucleoside-triphosphate reductase [archaeon]|nr:anaerobic ribonucleoside-triphosphate reductase [archaeon]
MTTDKDNLDIFKNKNSKMEFINKLLPEVFMSTGDVQKFNPKNIIESVVKEAGLTYKDAKTVTELVVRRIIASGIKFLSGPHIRELVCSALSELKFEDERKKFTRIGMPIHDYEELLESKYNERASEYTAPENIHRWAAGQLASEYTLLKLLSNDQNRSHLSGDIHIHSLRYFDMRPFSQSWDLRMILKLGLPPSGFLNSTVAKPAKKVVTAIMHATKWLGFAHSEFSGAQNYLYFNTFLAPYFKGMDYKEIKQIAQMFIFETNQQYIASGSHIPISSIVTSPKIPKILENVEAIGPGGVIKGTYADFEEENLDFFNALSEVYTEGDGNGKLFAFPKHKVLINSDWFESENLYKNSIEEAIKMGTPIFINNSLPWIKNGGYCGSFFSNLQRDNYLKNINNEDIFDWSKNFMNMGALQSVSINLPRISYEAKGDDDKLFENLSEKMKIAKEILLIKYNLIRKLLENKRLLLCSGIVDVSPENRFRILDLKRQALVFGYVGLNEMVQAHTGKQLHEDDNSLKFGIKVIQKMIKTCESYTKENDIFFTIWDQPAEFATYRFAALDLTHYSEPANEVVKGDSQNVYYTPSAHVNYAEAIDFNKRVQIHGNLSNSLQNNSSLSFWLNNSKNNNNPSIVRERIKTMLEGNLNEFSLNFDFSLCMECGKFFKGNKCENTNHKVKNISKITNYYTPLELWNVGKRQEFIERNRISF